jgi:hypothetical protein
MTSDLRYFRVIKREIGSHFHWVATRTAVGKRSPERDLELSHICGAKRSGNELSALLVNGTPARTCGKWPILRKAASLLSGNLTRTPGPDLLVGPFQGDFLSVSSNQCTFG